MELPDLLIEEYKALRAEITQSIVKQHWIAAGGYVLSGTIAAAILHDLRANCMGLMLIPLCFFSAACLWLVECNRMVRASYFIAYVQWPRLAESVGNEYSGWEHWIRSDDPRARRFRVNQDVFQRLKVIGCPAALSIFALSTLGSIRGFDCGVISSLVATALGFSILFAASGSISNLATYRQ